LRSRVTSSKLVEVISVIAAVAAGVLAPSRPARAQATILHTFANTGTYGSFAPLIQATDGNFYGVAYAGGPPDAGTVFKMTPTGTLTVLHAFAGGATDGSHPNSLIQAADGNFYGTTYHGGAADVGTVFKMTPAGTVTVLYAFAGGTSPWYPNGLMQATDGNFYGTTYYGGAAGLGTVFMLTPAGTLTVPHEFAGGATDGSHPNGVIQASDGSFYGTTYEGGVSGMGTVFSMTPTGTERVLHSFAGGPADGSYPKANLLQATDGNFYGTTAFSSFYFPGIIFRMTPDGTLTILHIFTRAPNGDTPWSAVIQATDGNFYGTTTDGGTSGLPVMFRMTPAGVFTVVYDGAGGGLLQATDGMIYGFSTVSTFYGSAFKMDLTGKVTILAPFYLNTEGAHPSALIQATDGNLYGTTTRGGPVDSGTVFAMTPAGTVTTLHSFALPEEFQPEPNSLLQATDGNFYGTTARGGSAYRGTVFRMTPAGAYTMLHAFAGGPTDGAYPGSLIQAADGNFYGTTGGGGTADLGTVFKMTPDGTVTVLHSVAPSEGSGPNSLLQATDGNFYGITLGSVFKMTPTGTLTVLYAAASGSTEPSPNGLIQAADGNFYGTSAFGGLSNQGTIFRMTPAGIVTILHAFTGGATDPRRPDPTLHQARDGSFYGTTSEGGVSGFGTFFRMTPTGTVRVLEMFGGFGRTSTHTVVQAADGSFYGTSRDGGAFGLGVVFRIPVPTAGDFDSDEKADVTVYQPATGVWRVLRSGTNYTTSVEYQWGVSADLPVPADYDGDGKIDIAVYRPATGTWYTLLSTTNFTNYVAYQWGVSTDTPVPGDYDGDGKTDIAVYRPATGVWYVLLSTTNATSYVAYQWGVSTDTPVPGDYDGDGKTDVAIHRPETGIWYVLLSTTNSSSYASYQWGSGADLPVPADFDGDGKADIAIYRPSTGEWFLLLSTTGYTPYTRVVLGEPTDAPADVPVPADYDGDGIADIAIYRPASGLWRVLLSSRNFVNPIDYQWGGSNDVPVLKRP
jgi:uncharacterized repeat protein (TIGR03803 family)